MARATWLADVLTDAGLVVKPYSGWETRGRNDFTPKGIILHHTVTKPSTPDFIIDNFLATTGSSSTPAPLCNYSTNRDGTISLIAAGTANHGGVGRWLGVTGNKNFFGDEMKNAGSLIEPWPGKQLESARIAAAAILTHLTLTDAAWLCGHKEYATPLGRKTDPHTLNMNAERVLVTFKMNGVDMPWAKPGDPVNTLADVKAVHAWQGNEVMKPADIDYVEADPALLDNRWKIIVARVVGVIMK